METVVGGCCYYSLLPRALAKHGSLLDSPLPFHVHSAGRRLRETEGTAEAAIERRTRSRAHFKAPLCCASPTIASTPLPSMDQAFSDRPGLVFSTGSEVMPHPAKVQKGGEDAFFVSDHNGGVLGVADGVSGWAEENVDPALFARELMGHASAAVGSEETENCPQRLLAKAHEATSAIGAATAIVAILEKKEGILHIANVGDCGLRLLRKGKIVFATSTQEHYFDCPYQLSSEAGAQTSADATVYNIEVMEGDIIVMGSDGLFDNVYDKDIEQTVNVFGGSDRDSAQRLATALASLASGHSRDTNYESPYSQEAILQGFDVPWWKKVLGQKFTGGKLDDITVLTANVVIAEATAREAAAEATRPIVDALPVGGEDA